MPVPAGIFAVDKSIANVKCPQTSSYVPPSNYVVHVIVNNYDFYHHL